jgi:CopG family transcriptional regulator, nickel-responsive regulator
MEESLLAAFDRVVATRGSTRSEAFRDLARAWVSKSKSGSHAEAVAALTLVYQHHVRDLSHTLTEMQHELGEKVRSAMHVHLTHELCLEVVILEGHADELQTAADRILGTRGVTHGAIEIFAMAKDDAGGVAEPSPHAHPHPHPHPHRPATRGLARPSARRAKT